MKKLICLCLALAVLASLAAGCNVVIGPEVPTTVPVNEADLEAVRNQFGELDADAEEALRIFLSEGGRPEDLVIDDTPPMTMPPPMPEGSPAAPDVVRPLMEKMFATFASDSFMIKARGTSPLGGASAAPMTIAMNRDAIAFEVEIDWAGMLRAEGQSNAQAAFTSASIQALLGKRMRFVIETNGVKIVFPDKNTYMSLSDLAEEEGEEPLNLEEFIRTLSGMFGGAASEQEAQKRMDSIVPSRVTADGKEYLCATVTLPMEGTNETVIMRYYFLGEELRRVETQTAEDSVMVEIDVFTSQVDQSLFNTNDMRTMNLEEMAKMGSNIPNLGGLLGVGG